MNTLTRPTPTNIDRAFASGTDDLATTLMQSGLVPFVVVHAGHIVAASPALRELLGGTSPYHHIDGSSLASAVAEADRAIVSDFCTGLLAKGARGEQRCNLLHADGSLVPVLLSGKSINVDTVRQIVLLVTDLTPWVGTTVARTDGAAALPGAFDAATGFATRALLSDRMRIALAAARRHRRRAAVLRIDLQHFATLLDSLVPEAAGEIEATVAETLRNGVRDSDTIARLGTDQFVLLLAEITERDDAGISAARVVAAVASLFERNDPAHRVSAHIGVAVYPTDGTSAERLLQGADAALRGARSLAGGGLALADATTAELADIEPLEFRAEYLTGVADIDVEHRALVARVNALVHDLRASADLRRLEGDVRALSDLLRDHFANEAHHLGTSPYEGAIDMKTRNLRFLDELDCILLHVNAQSILLAIRHLHDWLVPHLQSFNDRQVS